MKTRNRKAAEPFGELRRISTAAHDRRTRQLIELVSPDRTTVRPPLAVLEVDAGRDPQVIPAGYLFSASGPSGNVDLVTVGEAIIPPVQLDHAERIGPGSGDHMGIRLHLRRLGNHAIQSLRFHVENLDTFVDVLRDTEVYSRAETGELRRLSASAGGVEEAPQLYPVAPLGCQGRAMLTAFFHATPAFAFVDVALDNPATDQFELLILFRDAAVASRVDPAAFRLGCVPVVNRRVNSVNVTVEPTTTFEPVPVPEGQVVAEIARVQAFQGQGEWAECRRWLGARYPWKHRKATSVQYVLDGQTGDRRLSIGLVEPGRGLDATATHLNVQLILADPSASRLPQDTPAIGDRGEKATLVVEASRLLLPSEIDPAELEAEFRANGWMNRGRAGDATDGLRSLLEQAAACYAANGNRVPRPPARRVADAIRRVTIGSSRIASAVPVLAVELELGDAELDPTWVFLFAAVLERALPFFAPPLTATQLTIRTPEGVQTWAPRSPAA